MSPSRLCLGLVVIVFAAAFAAAEDWDEEQLKALDKPERDFAAYFFEWGYIPAAVRFVINWYKSHTDAHGVTVCGVLKLALIIIFILFPLMVPAMILGFVTAVINLHYDPRAAVATFPPKALISHNIRFMTRWIRWETVVAVPFAFLAQFLYKQWTESDRCKAWINPSKLGHFHTLAQILIQFPLTFMKQILPALLLGVNLGLVAKSVAIHSAFVGVRVAITAILDHYSVKKHKKIFLKWFTYAFICVIEILAAFTCGTILFRHPVKARMLVTLTAALFWYGARMPAPHHIYLSH